MLPVLDRPVRTSIDLAAVNGAPAANHQRARYEVSAAATLQKALVLLEAESFDAIIADIGLPDGTGYALVSEARRQAKNVMAIAFSAYPYPSDVDEAKATGFDYHLSKPIDLPLLRSLLEKKDSGG